jgi:hypothetical protein
LNVTALDLARACPIPYAYWKARGGAMAIEVKANFHGHNIAVSIAAFDTTSSKLYIDGAVVDTASRQSSPFGALLRGSLKIGQKTHIVEIKRPYAFFNRPSILIDGKRIDSDA